MKKLYLAFIIGVFGISVSVAVFAEQWPQDTSTYNVFSQNREVGFASFAGLKGPDLQAVDHWTYHFFEPFPAWISHLDCSESSRKGGFIQTNSNTVISEHDVAVAVAIKFQLRTKFIQGEKERILYMPFLKSSIHIYNRDKNALELLENHINIHRIGEMYIKSGGNVNDHNAPLDFSFNSILIGNKQTLPQGAQYLIRLDWSFNGLCGEEPFLSDNPSIEFAIGDQIRLLSVDE